MDWISPRVCRAAGTASFAVALLLPCAALAEEPPRRPDIRVARLVRDLGAADYSKRQAADRELSDLGGESRAALEAALEDDDVEVRLRAQRLLERLKLDELWAPGRVDFSASGQPASKVLLELAAQSRNHIHVGDPYGNFAEKVLDGNYTSMTYWEAVDDICRRTGNRIRPHYDMHTPGVVVSAGAPGNYPRAYAGPVRAQVTSARRVFIEELNYEEQKAELTHSFQINLQFTWEDRFRMVGYATQPELVEALTNDKVTVAAAQGASGGWNATSRGLRQVAASLKLNPVPVSARSLDMLKIKWGLVAVGEPATLHVDDLDTAKVHSQDDVCLKIDGIEKQTGGKVMVSITVVRDLVMPEPQEIVFQEYDVELIDEQGRPYRQQSTSPSLGERGVQLKIAYIGESSESQPASLRLHYPRVRARRNLELVFRNVPLPLSKPE